MFDWVLNVHQILDYIKKIRAGRQTFVQGKQ